MIVAMEAFHEGSAHQRFEGEEGDARKRRAMAGQYPRGHFAAGEKVDRVAAVYASGLKSFPGDAHELQFAAVESNCRIQIGILIVREIGDAHFGLREAPVQI